MQTHVLIHGRSDDIIFSNLLYSLLMQIFVLVNYDGETSLRYILGNPSPSRPKLKDQAEKDTIWNNL